MFREIKRLGPVETSLYLFGPEVQECLSPDFDRDRPSHLIRRPVTSGHLNRIASRYGLASSITSRKQTPVSYPLLESRKKQRFGSDLKKNIKISISYNFSEMKISNHHSLEGLSRHFNVGSFYLTHRISSKS